MQKITKALQGLQLSCLNPAVAEQEDAPGPSRRGPVSARAMPNPNLPQRVRPQAAAAARTLACWDDGLTVPLALINWMSKAPAAERAARKEAAARIRVATESGDGPIPLELNGLGLTSLPACMDELHAVASLDVSGNQLTALGPLPPNLMELDASMNRLETLPELPEDLVVLEVYCNQLTELPELPADLKSLDASRNSLTHVGDAALPEHELPPELNDFDLRWNPLERCPVLPASLDHFALSTHYMRNTTYLQQISGHHARELEDTHVLGERQETPPFKWNVTLPDYD